MTSYINARPDAGLFRALIEVFAVAIEMPWAGHALFGQNEPFRRCQRAQVTVCGRAVRSQTKPPETPVAPLAAHMENGSARGRIPWS